MKDQLAIDITLKTLMKFTLPSIVMMIFMSLYTMVDGIFVTQLINTTALSAINITFPVVSVVVAIGVMLGAGGSAVCATLLGKNEKQKAKSVFTMIVLFGASVGLVMSVLGHIFIEPIVVFLGVDKGTQVYEYVYQHLNATLKFVPFAILQMMFSFFFVTAGKPSIGLVTTIGAGVTNIVLDYVFIHTLDLGIAGAGYATGTGNVVTATVGLLYFFSRNKSMLQFEKPQFDGKILLQTCANGSSEMVTNMATAVTTLQYNYVMNELLGDDGVAAITTVLYAQFLLVALFLGYTSGVAPLFSYNRGEDNGEKLKKLYSISLKIIAVCSVALYIASVVFGDAISMVFASGNQHVYDLSVEGLRIFGISFLFAGFNIFASGMFTAFSNGRISSTISFMRTFVFLVSSIALLPKVLYVTGVWLAVPVAELLTLAISIYFLCKYKKRYNY